jgi:transcriptional regulator with XRE-family HTH domain
MNLGEQVREARLRRRMTIGTLAAASHLSKGFISQLERGLSNPSLESLGRIAAALDLALPTLLGGAPNAPHAEEKLRVIPSDTLRKRGPGITVIASGEQGTSALVVLGRGDLLVGRGTDRAAPGNASCYVAEGEILLRQGEAELRAGSGDAAVWGAAKACEVACVSAIQASLVVTVPPGYELQVIHPSVEVMAQKSLRVAAAVPPGGPFNLVAMRAQRGAGRER